MPSPIEAVSFNDAFAVTPSDSTVFSKMASALFVGTGGNVVVRTAAGNSVTFTGIPDGGWILVKCDMVKSTSTTASNIVAYTY